MKLRKQTSRRENTVAKQLKRDRKAETAAARKERLNELRENHSKKA
jgi:hypothetical protein